MSHRVHRGWGRVLSWASCQQQSCSRCWGPAGGLPFSGGHGQAAPCRPAAAETRSGAPGAPARGAGPGPGRGTQAGRGHRASPILPCELSAHPTFLLRHFLSPLPPLSLLRSFPSLSLLTCLIPSLIPSPSQSVLMSVSFSQCLLQSSDFLFHSLSLSFGPLFLFSALFPLPTSVPFLSSFLLVLSFSPFASPICSWTHTLLLSPLASPICVSAPRVALAHVPAPHSPSSSPASSLEERKRLSGTSPGARPE